MKRDLLDDTQVYDDEQFIEADFRAYEDVAVQRLTRSMSDLRMFRVIEYCHRPKEHRVRVNGRLMIPRMCPDADYRFGFQGYQTVMRRASEWTSIAHQIHVVSKVGRRNLIDEQDGELLEFAGRALLRKAMEAADYFTPEEWLEYRERQAMDEGRSLSEQGFYGLTRRNEKIAERILTAIGDDLLMAYGYLRTQWLEEVPKYVNTWRKHKGLKPVRKVQQREVPEWDEPEEGEEE